ncbi:hypothetical protein J3B00_000054 [Pseudomonas sp. BP8]|nr:hypothetical protein [Pseudomonas sp. BP8]
MGGSSLVISAYGWQVCLFQRTELETSTLQPRLRETSHIEYNVLQQARREAVMYS